MAHARTVILSLVAGTAIAGTNAFASDCATVYVARETTAAPGPADAYEFGWSRFKLADAAQIDITAARSAGDRGPDESRFEQFGTASWYGNWHHGRPTASGTPFDMHGLTAAHPTLPLGTTVRVTNLDNGRSVDVTINDRGPYVDDRIIDLSKRAARAIDMVETGLAPVKVEALPSDAQTAGAGAGNGSEPLN
ncbi:MAG TPA: septal ring lytic transglycosylase RlpA family protein [Alphaproteobacteria bacterium]